MTTVKTDCESLPLITVGIATYKRAPVLRQMIDCLVRQEYPPDRFELLVIDNNSPDNTRAVVAGFEMRSDLNAHPQASTRGPKTASPKPTLLQAQPEKQSEGAAPFPHRVRYIHEPQQGLGHARNRAIAEARGDLIVLPDDDILMNPNWLRTLCAPLIAEWHEGRRSIGCVAGEVVPIFPDGLPDWIREWHGPQGFRSADEGPGPLTKTAYPMGANFAFPRWIFEQLGAFSTALDRKGASFFGGGDREMLHRIYEADYAVWFVPAASVLHQMPASRTFRYAARHAFDSARSRVVERTRLGSDKCVSLGGGKSSNQITRAGSDMRAHTGVYLVSRFFANALKAVGFAFVALGCALIFRCGAAKKSLVRAWRCCGYLYQVPRSLFGRV